MHEFTSKQATALDSLSAQAPPTAADAFRTAAGIVADIEQQARVLCVACGQGAPLALSEVLNPASATLDELLVGPSRQVTAPAGLEALRKQAEAASKTAPAAPTTTGGSTTSPTTPNTAPPVLPKVTEAVGNQAVTNLLNSLGANQGPLAPITTPLGKTVDGTLGGVTGTLEGLLKPKQ